MADDLPRDIAEMAQAMIARRQACEAYGGKAFYPKETTAFETIRDMLAYAYKHGGVEEMESWAADIALAAFRVSRTVRQHGGSP